VLPLASILQVQLPAPKPGSKRGCVAVAAAAAAAAGQSSHGDAAVGLDTELEGAAACSGTDEGSDDDYDMGEDGACCICYSLHLQDPEQPDQIGACCGCSGIQGVVRGLLCMVRFVLQSCMVLVCVTVRAAVCCSHVSCSEVVQQQICLRCRPFQAFAPPVSSMLGILASCGHTNLAAVCAQHAS
jgi:hypothetical protein